MKITVLDAETLGNDVDISVFERFGELEVFQRTASEDTVARTKNSTIVITNKVVIDKTVIDACPQLKLVCISATGMNNVDLAYAEESGVQVKNVAGYSTASVAQFTFACLLGFLHRLPYYDNYVKSNDYTESNLFTHIADGFGELTGKTYGIIGLGNIGRRVAEIAKVFGAEVLYYSTSGKNSTEDYPQVSLEELFTRSDYISVHCPLNAQTENMVTEKFFKIAKPGLVILNMGRGGIINEADLAAAVDTDLIAGAVTDVYTAEPVPADNPLIQVRKKEKLLLTPHIAWASTEARQLLMKKLVKNIESFLQSQA